MLLAVVNTFALLPAHRGVPRGTASSMNEANTPHSDLSVLVYPSLRVWKGVCMLLNLSRLEHLFSTR